MDDITAQALTNITGVLQSFLPPANPSVDQSLIVIPQQVKPTGLGGYVGVHTSPDASLVGRRIQAVSEITFISNSGVTDLQAAVNGVTQQLMAQDRQTLRNNGIFKLSLNSLGDIVHSGTGGNATDSRSIEFALDFEYIPVPVEPEGIISEFVHNFDLALSSGKAKFLQHRFASINAAGDNPLDLFDVEDDPDVAGSSPSGSWSYNVGNQAIEQSNNVRGGPASLAGKKAGAHALLIENNAAYQVQNAIIRTNVSSTDLDGIGLVFRKQDNDNFYYLLFSARHDYTLLGKKVQGSYSLLSEGGTNESIGHTESDVMEIKLVMDGSNFSVYRNNQFIVEGMDVDIPQEGRLGFLTHRNSSARFYDLAVVDFDG